MVMKTEMAIHPTIKKCLNHLSVIGADDRTKQIVYMYMETLIRETHDKNREGLPIVNTYE